MQLQKSDRVFVNWKHLTAKIKSLTSWKINKYSDIYTVGENDIGAPKIRNIFWCTISTLFIVITLLALKGVSDYFCFTFRYYLQEREWATTIWRAIQKSSNLQKRYKIEAKKLGATTFALTKLEER